MKEGDKTIGQKDEKGIRSEEKMNYLFNFEQGDESIILRRIDSKFLNLSIGALPGTNKQIIFYTRKRCLPLMKNITKLLGFFLLINYSLMAQWTNGQNAAYVIGQPDFNTYSQGTTNKNLSCPWQIAIDYINSKMYVADYYNSRVLRFAYPITSNNPAAERIFGITASPGCTKIQMKYPTGVAVYKGTLWVSDYGNQRILKFDIAHLAATDSPSADGVIGQTDFTTSSYGTTASKFYAPINLCIDESGNLWVGDDMNNRVLKFNDINNKTNGANADLVLGQPDFLSATGATTQSTMYLPYGVAVLGTTVWVADYGNSRVLRFDNPTTNGANANGVLGESNFTTGVYGCTNSLFYTNMDVCVDPNGTLYVSDFGNSRIMIFNNAAAKPNGGAADVVLGQSNFTSLTSSNGGQNAFYSFFDGEDWYRGISCVTVDAANKQLFVSDYSNNRIMVFGAGSPLPVELGSFTARAEGNGVLLNWKTVTEVNNYGFDIERKSVDAGSEWKKVGFVNGSGNSNSKKEYTFSENNNKAGKYSYRLKQIDKDGGVKYSAETEVEIKPIPTEYVLHQNYPNPFNPSTTISYSLPKDGNVVVKIFNAIGVEVKTLVNGNKAAGNYSVTFNMNNNPSGIYFCRMESGEFSSTRKIMLMK